METITYELRGVIPHSTLTGVDFQRIEMPAHEYLPLALVWYTLRGETEERGSRIDLDKQVFLDSFGEFENSGFNAEAQLVVQFVRSCVTNAQHVSAAGW